MNIDPEDFATECIQWALYCGMPAHYMVAVAQMRGNGINDDTDGDKTGPFRFTQPTWDAFRSDAEFEVNFSSAEIASWRRQCLVFAVMTDRAFDRFSARESRNPTAVELYIEEFGDTDATALTAALKTALDSTADDVREAGIDFFGQDPGDAGIIDDPNAPPKQENVTSLNPRGVPAGRLDIANQIFAAFSAAPLTGRHGISAVANAIAESSLNPKAQTITPRESSFGLFQLNLKGLGAGHAPAELVDAASNIKITLAQALKIDKFVRSPTVDMAVDAFVRLVERPEFPNQEVVKRQQIARRLVRANGVAVSGAGLTSTAASVPTGQLPGVPTGQLPGPKTLDQKPGWIYAQKTGNMFHVENGGAVLKGSGYSGNGADENNPAAQFIPQHGPIPQGWYTIGPPEPFKNMVNCLPLTPDPGNNMGGRSGFLIHDGAFNNPLGHGNTSEGCICLPQIRRIEIWDSGDRRLQVVADLPVSK